MALLQLSFLGTFDVTLDGQPVTGFESGKVRALLAYLATQSDRAHSRSVLVGLLWPEQPEDAARANLRQALSNLRRALGDQHSPAPFLHISRDTVQFDAAGTRQDVEAFNALLDECNRHAHRRAELCTPCSQRLAQAVGLYRGPFLDGLFVHDSLALEEWILLQREILQRRVLQALYQLAAYHERRGAYNEAYDFALRQIELDPWREEAHRQAMRVLVLRGERSAALAQYEACRHLLEEGLGVEPSEETTALYRQIRSAQDDTQLAPDRLALPSIRPHNLPPQPTPFIGRERELTELARLIEQHRYRLITLAGQGGSGKTRIALQAASEQIEGFLDGVRYVSLAPVHSSAYLVSTIGAALGILFSGQKDERAQLLDELRDKEMLLVLDNFEHLLDAADFLTEILQEAPGVTILTTSRERLNLHGEWVLAVEGLPYPTADAVEPSASFPAVQLFLQSARRSDSRFAPGAEEEEAIVRICHMVGGLPLAIELAAAWTPVLSSEEISLEIARSLDFLATDLRDIPERHRSLRVVFDYSWNMLSGEERDLLSRLSVFRGGFRREAAEQGAGATLPLLLSLLAKSFLRRSPLGRYEIHELLRQYAESKLGEAAHDKDDARNRHSRYYADFVRSREDKLRGKGHLSAREEIAAEIDNIREAWRWAVERGKWEELEKLAGGLWFFYEIGGLFQEADAAYERAALALEERIESGSENERSVLGTRYSVLLGKLMARRGGFIGARMGRIEEGRDLLEQSVSLFRQFDEPWETAFSLNLLGSIARSLCRYEQAKEYFEESLQLFREISDRWGSAYSLSDLGTIAHLLGNHSEAGRLHQESLLISRQTGDRRAMLFCLNDSTGVAIALGEYQAGLHSCNEALAISRAIAHRWGEATALYWIGVIVSHTGNELEARTLLQDSLAAFREIGDPQGAAQPLQHLGYLAYSRKEYAQAQQLFQEALSICRAVGYPRGSAAALNGLGKTAHGVGELETARFYLREAMATATGIHAWPLVIDILVSIAAVEMGGSSDTERALSSRILSLACNHPATESHTREEARDLLGRCAEAEPTGPSPSFLGAGGSLRPTMTSPDVQPDHLAPAIALQQILEEYGLG
jgi:DNA-binding SARP family transcriptional activator/predicted ATPase